MSSGTDIDQLLAQAAAPERARHVDPDFVLRVEHALEQRPRRSLLGLLPALALVLAGVLTAPVLTGGLGNLVTFWDWLAEPLGLRVLLEALSGAGLAVLWPYLLGLIVLLLPFSLLDAEF